MSKSLYEEALADAKQLLELAEDNAKKAVIEAVTPKIRSLLEKELLAEAPIDEENEDDLLLDLTSPDAIVAASESNPIPVDDVVDATMTAAISLPDAEGKVTLDLDALGTTADSQECEACAEEEFELTAESLEALKVLSDTNSGKISNVLQKMERFAEDIKLFSGAGKLIKETKAYEDKIDQLIERIEDTYLYVTETISESPERKVAEDKLEEFYKGANRLKESTMGKNKKVLKEEDLTIRITNLPDGEDGLDPDSLGVDLIVGEDEGDDEELDLDSEEGSEDMEMSDDTELEVVDDEEEELPMEALNLSDDTIVEISESMLRQEIARMKKLRMKESAMPVEDFGGGSDEGDPLLDVELTTEAQCDEDEEEMKEVQKKEDDAVKAESRKRKAKSVNEGKLQQKASANQKPSQTADVTSDALLRKKLDETNLFNTKLLATNKLLQNESLGSKQKAAAIEKLEEAKSVREVKLVYESIVKALSGRSQLSESRVIGSSSRPTKSSGASLTEAVETNRWARLAGINNK